MYNGSKMSKESSSLLRQSHIFSSENNGLDFFRMELPGEHHIFIDLSWRVSILQLLKILTYISMTDRENLCSQELDFISHGQVTQ